MKNITAFEVTVVAEHDPTTAVFTIRNVSLDEALAELRNVDEQPRMEGRRFHFARHGHYVISVQEVRGGRAVGEALRHRSLGRFLHNNAYNLTRELRKEVASVGLVLVAA